MLLPERDESNASYEFKVGSRLICDGFFGTLRYVGHVPPTEGVWLGVEWDNPTRGKHNGTCDEVQYFKTDNPTSGSFIRPKKADFGITCLAAIRQQYCEPKEKIQSEEQEDMFIVMRNNSVIPVEAVGFEQMKAKQSQLDKLKQVCIASKRVSRSGPEGELRSSVPNIIELDLSRNLLSSWKEVSKISRQLKYLTALNLSDNRLGMPVENSESSFHKVELMMLNKMNYSWQELLICSKMWAQVKQLHLAFNRISTLAIPNDAGLWNVEELVLEGNPIEYWEEVINLGHLPKLRFLNLNNTGMRNVHFPDAQPGNKTALFPALQVLFLQNNELKQWSDINELNKLPLLNNFSVKNNPFEKLDRPENVWQIIIARIGGLKTLNRCLISPSERRGAELDYIKKYGKEWLEVANTSVGENRDAFAFNHPRYLHLIDVHGAVEESELKTQLTTLKNSLMELELICTNKVNCKPIHKKIPSSLTVQKLRGLVHRLFKDETGKLILFSSSKKRPNVKIEMDNDLRELSFYAENGDQILAVWE